VTSDPAVAAFCMAGGKILVGSEFVKSLDLSDGELAMLLAHEMAHALADHRRPVARRDMDIDPAEEVRLARMAMEQEVEADGIGMRLAHRAGWPAASLVGFFEKLAVHRGAGSFSSSHPPSDARIAAAREVAAQLAP
jgi:predicted Zn-dependent protease